MAVKPDETKWETKIFAGGAVIARDGATGPQWVTADSVTGSSVTWRNIDTEHFGLGISDFGSIG